MLLSSALFAGIVTASVAMSRPSSFVVEGSPAAAAAATAPHHHHHSHDIRTPPPRSLVSDRRPTPEKCPWPGVAAALDASGGRLSVKLYDNYTVMGMDHDGHGGGEDTEMSGAPPPAVADDGPAIRWAINASHLCGGVVFFPQGRYHVNGTIDLPKDTTLVGGGGRGSDQFQTSPEGAGIWGLQNAPVFRGRNTMKIRFENLVVVGKTIAVEISGGALIRVVNCAFHAQVVASAGPDAVNTSAAGCVGCNVVLRSNNTAFLVENTYWLWVEDSSFFFIPLYSSHGAINDDERGQRPSVILRGYGDSAATW